MRDGLDTLVVARGVDAELACKDYPALVEWVRATAPRVRRVASICSGAFILAAGLLYHRRVTTHWLFSERLATAYPSIQVNSNLLFARDKLFAEAQKHPAAKKTATKSCQFESTQ